MAYASIKYTGASGTTFALTNSNGDPIEYLQQNDISVYVNNVLKTVGTDYTFNGAGTAIVLNTAVSGAEVYITRTTDISDAVVDFTPGSTLTSNDLNNSNDQYRFALQEFRDTYAALTQGTDDLGEFPGIIDSTEGWISDDSHWPTTAALDNRFVDQINNESINGIKTFTSSPVVPTPTTGTQAVNKAYVDDNYWNVDGETINTSEQNAGSPAWDDTKITTAGAAAKRHDTVVQTTAPSGTDWQIGKFWLQNDANKTLSYWTGSNWSGIASGGTFTLQPTVIYVDSVNGNDTNDGHRIINPKKTIKNAVQSANAGDIIKVAPGVYQEVLPIDITVDNLSIVGDSQRSCFVYPTVATQEQIMFRCNSGTYIDGFTFAGLKASGARGGHAIDNNATYGLPASQGWVAGFYPGCIIKKSPYINNCSNFADASIDNSNFNPNNYAGTGGDLTSAPTGGGIIVDGSVPSVNSPLRSFVVNEFTQVCLDGPGLLVCNNGYAQAVSFFGLFCHYHAKALSGGQINMEVGTTDFGRYGLIADGKSSSAIFTATANGNASAGATTFAINAPTAAGSWFGDANRPSINMLVQIGADIYPILSSTANGAGWNVVISRPDPANRAVNLGLINGHSSGATVSFFLRSMISTASHTMEYAGSGTNYNALPENGGVPVEANEVVNLNNGKVWLTSTDQSGKFKVGDTFQVDQQTGFVTIDPNSYSPNIVQDLSPELGGNLDVLTRNIYSSVGNVQINDTLDVTGPILSSTGNVYINDTLEVNSGTAAAPAITFNGDTNTGIYRPGADQVAISTNGSGRLFVDSTGRVGINQSAPNVNLMVTTTASGEGIRLTNGTNSERLHFYTGSNALVEANNANLALTAKDVYALTLSTNNLERARIDNSGRLLVGTSSARTNVCVYDASTATTPKFQYETVVDNYSNGFSLINNSIYGPNLTLGGTGAGTGGSIGQNTLVSNGRGLGTLNWAGADGTKLVPAADITCYVDGAPGANDMPGRLVFSTTADGASSPTEAMRINNQRELLIGTTTRTANGGVLQVSNGITFPATQSACTDPNTLDDYEEGTWTPSIYSDNLSFVAADQRYIKIGKYVWLTVKLDGCTSFNAAGSNPLIIFGLPFTSSPGTTAQYVAKFDIVNALTSWSNINAFISDSGNRIRFSTHATNAAAATEADLNSFGARAWTIRGTITYQVA